MLRIHQPYIKKEKVKHFLTLASIGVFLLGSWIVVNSSSESSIVYAVGDSRTIHDIENMQDMTQQICSNTAEEETATLIDTRGASKADYKTYTIVKLLDGNCWMGQNLALTGPLTLTNEDSDVVNDWILPTSITSWTSNNGTAQVKTGNGGLSGWKNGYGNYYSFCAATAESCKDESSNFISDEATESICPKEWKLPAAHGSGSLYNLRSIMSDWTTMIYNGSTGVTGYYLGSISTTIHNSANFWPTAGQIRNTDGLLIDSGTNGYYWSRSISSGPSATYLGFGIDDVPHMYAGWLSLYSGHSVRCVALGGLEKIEKPTWEESVDGNVTVNVPSILTIDTTSGMDKIADASKIIEGTATATISSNTEYSVTLHSSESALRDTENSTNTTGISPVSDSNPVQPGNNSWGLWNGTSDPKTYTLPLTTIATEFPNTTSSSITDKGNTTTHTYYVGISISPALPSGTYGTNVVITASVK